MYDDLGSDGLIRCPRCGDQDALIGEICLGCKRELEAHHDHEMGWRKAWELEKDDELRRLIKIDGNLVYRRLDMLEWLGREYKDDPQMSNVIALEKANFEARWARVTKT